MSTGMIVGAIVVLLLLAGGWYYMSKSSSPQDAMEADESAMMEKDGDSMMMEGGHDGDAMMKDDGDSMMMKDESGDAMMEKGETSFKGAVIAGSSSPLLEFDQRDYETALESGRVVVLYFYANWCPLCKAEFSTTKAAFEERTDANVVGFRVHYNDNQVTKEMEALAREYGVAYQHTKVFVKDGKRILKSPETWPIERYRAEISNAIN